MALEPYVKDLLILPPTPCCPSVFNYAIAEAFTKLQRLAYCIML